MRALFLSLLLAIPPALARAECAGQNLLETMPAEQRAALDARVEQVPFARGNLWQATKDGRVINLLGTYHLDDPRHQATLDQITPLIETAAVVLVEAGPDEERALMERLSREPQVMLLPDSSLPGLMNAQDWKALSQALNARGIPPFMAARFQPWYVSLLLSVPVCEVTTLQSTPEKGIDGMIVDRALELGKPVRALEPYDTMFTIFDTMTIDQQLSMIRGALATEDRADDYAHTLAESYFSGDSWMVWELMRDEVKADGPRTREEMLAEVNMLEQVMMTGRNRGWLPKIIAAAEEGPVLAAFGALHLPGENGVAALLQAEGWELTPFPEN